MSDLTCKTCARTFKRKKSLEEHIKNILNPCSRICIGCNDKSSSRKSFYRHKIKCEKYQAVKQIIENGDEAGSVNNNVNNVGNSSIGTQNNNNNVLNNNNVVLMQPFDADHYFMKKEAMVGPYKNYVVDLLKGEKYADAYEQVFKVIHGNPKLPEHQNIYVQNLDGEDVVIFRGKDFKMERLPKFMPRLFGRLKYEMRWMVKTCDELTDAEKDQLQWDIQANWMVINEESDKNMKRILFNNKNVVLNTMKNNTVKPDVEMISKLIELKSDEQQKSKYVPRKKLIEHWLDIGDEIPDKNHLVCLP